MSRASSVERPGPESGRPSTLDPRPSTPVPHFSFVALCATGYWFCNECQRITVPSDEDKPRCTRARCHSYSLRWCPPLPRKTEPNFEP